MPVNDYSHQVQDYFTRRQHVGVLPRGPRVVQARVGSIGEGMVLQLHFAWNAARCLHAVKFKAYGCAATLASMAWLAENLVGRTVAELQTISAEHIAQALQLPETKYSVAVMVQHLVRQSLSMVARIESTALEEA